MAYAIVNNGTPIEINGGFTDNDGNTYNANALEIWTPQERLAKGIRPIVDGDVPYGYKATGSSLTWDTQTVTRVYTTEAIPLADLKAAKQSALARRRWQAEEGGTTLGGQPLATDRTTQTKLTAAYIKASADSEYTIPAWKSGPGIFSALDAATIIAAADAIEAHVQACFANEAALSGEIDAATTIAELSAVDIEASWP
jgi:hypothetical protein